MRTRILSILATASILAPVVVAGPLSSVVECEDCIYNTTSISKFGVATWDEGSQMAWNRAIEDLDSTWCMDWCEYRFPNCQISMAMPFSPGENITYYHLESVYNSHYTYDVTGTCECYEGGGEPIGIGDRVAAPPTPLQKVQNIYNNVKQSIFKRLFGGRK